MNEKGIIAYFNVFVIFFVSLFLMVSLLDTLASVKNDEYYIETVQSIDYIEDSVNELMKKLSSYDTMPKEIFHRGGQLVRINVVDEDEKIYSATLYNGFDLMTFSKYGNCNITFKQESKGLKLLKMELN